jgi:hypothetical protein
MNFLVYWPGQPNQQRKLRPSPKQLQKPPPKRSPIQKSASCGVFDSFWRKKWRSNAKKSRRNVF